MADKSTKTQTPVESAGEFLVSARDKVVGAAGDAAGAVQEAGKSAGTEITKGVNAAGDYINKNLPAKAEEKPKEDTTTGGGGVGSMVGDCVNKAKGLFGGPTDPAK